MKRMRHNRTAKAPWTEQHNAGGQDDATSSLRSYIILSRRLLRAKDTIAKLERRKRLLAEKIAKTKRLLRKTKVMSR